MKLDKGEIQHYDSELRSGVSYLDGVLDLVGEVLERAHGDGLLGRIGRGRVRLGLVRQDGCQTRGEACRR